MSAFQTLREISCDFENDLRLASAELFSVKLCEPFEDVIANMIRDFSILTSKFNLLQAKSLASASEVTEINKNEQLTLGNYGEAVSLKIIEQQLVMSVMQRHVVKKIVTTPNAQLLPHIVEIKRKIIENLLKLRTQESVLYLVYSILEEKELKLLETRKRWDEVVNRLKDSKQVPHNREKSTGPLYQKLQTLVNKMELMRWMISKMVTSRTDDYDWAADPQNLLRALPMTRQHHCIEDYTETV